MRILSATSAVAAVGLSLSGTAHAQDVRMPQGEYFSINAGGDWFRAMPADPGSETSGSSTGMLNHESGFNEYIGVWTVDHATGAMTITFTMVGDTHCDAWPDYVVGETIDMTVPSEKTCWIPGGTDGTEMTYVGLNPPEQ